MLKKIEFRFLKKRVVKVLIKDYQLSKMADFIESELSCNIINVKPEVVCLIIRQDLNKEMFSDKVIEFYERTK